MLALIASLVISASGDPYIKQTTTPELLTSGQRTTLANAVLSRAPGLLITDILTLQCAFTETVVCCTPLSADVKTAAQAKALLESGETWEPAPETNANYKSWDNICVTGTPRSAFITLISSIDPTVAGLPIYTTAFERLPGSVDVYQTCEYGVEGTEAWIGAHMEETLIPMGIVP